MATRNGSVWALVDPWNIGLGFIVSGSAEECDPEAFLPAYAPHLHGRKKVLANAHRLASEGAEIVFNRPGDPVWGLGVGDDQTRARLPVLKDRLSELLAGFRAVKVDARGRPTGKPIELHVQSQPAKPMVKATANGRRVGVSAHS